MGSESDLNVMLGAAEVLKLFDVRYELKIVSAHRTVDKMIEYGRTCRTRGIRVIIAGAGGAAPFARDASFINKYTCHWSTNQDFP